MTKDYVTQAWIIYGDAQTRAVALSSRERAVALVSNGIAVYSMYRESGSLPENVSVIDFVLKAVPEDLRPEVTAELIDEVFAYVSGAHGS